MSLDFTGTCRHLWGWLAKIQFVPAVLALNIGVVIALIAITLLLGRVYCSVICPLGIMQDIFTHIRGWFKIGCKKKNRFKYTEGYKKVRWILLILFVICMAIPVAHVVASLIEPYSAYGRIVSSLLSPVYDDANNLLADIAEKNDSYTFYEVTRSSVGIVVTVIAVVTLIVVGTVAFFSGRDYCNTVCPVGTLLGFFARFSLLKPWIDTTRCNGCTKCARNCKAKCIDPVRHQIDYSRCVACMDCICNCSTAAIRYSIPRHKVVEPNKSEVDKTRRMAMVTGAVVTGSLLMKGAEEKIFDGGLAVIVPKKPVRAKRISPAGSQSVRHFADHCTGCQLCVMNCPNEVLRPSTDLETLMQPVMEYDKGYCRPECVACSSVCPVGAIRPITAEEKSDISIGMAVVDRDRCISAADGVSCGNCARHCPSGAIIMVPMSAADDNSNKMPVVNQAACIGCGACENLCPVNPVSAIHVEGRATHVQVKI